MDIGMEEAHTVFLSIPDDAINQDFYEENLPDDKVLDEDVSSGIKKEAANVEEAEEKQYLEQHSVQDITSIIKEEVILDETEEVQQQIQELDSLAAMGSVIQEEVHSTEKCKDDMNDSDLSESCSYSTSVVLEQSRGNMNAMFVTKRTPAKYSLKDNLFHVDITKNQCDIYNRSPASQTARSNSLSQDKLTHSGIRNYQCDIYNKTFTQSTSLSKHKSINTGIKKYKCEICNKTYSLLRFFLKHKSMHPRIKRYKCDICSKEFGRSRYLTQHQLRRCAIKF